MFADAPLADAQHVLDSFVRISLSRDTHASQRPQPEGVILNEDMSTTDFRASSGYVSSAVCLFVNTQRKDKVGAANTT